MTTEALRQSKVLRESFKRFGRAGLSERVIQLISEYTAKPLTYKGAIELAGRMRAIALTANADDYWSEKCSRGFYDECWWLEYHKAIVEKDEGGDTKSVKFEKREAPEVKS